MSIKELNAEVLAKVDEARQQNLTSVFNLEAPVKTVSSTSSSPVSTGTRGSRSGNAQAILEVLKTNGKAMKGSEITNQLVANGVDISSKQVSDLLWALAGGVSDSDTSLNAQNARANAPIFKVAKGVYQYKQVTEVNTEDEGV